VIEQQIEKALMDMEAHEPVMQEELIRRVDRRVKELEADSRMLSDLVAIPDNTYIHKETPHKWTAFEGFRDVENCIPCAEGTSLQELLERLRNGGKKND
jgi:hypothetical protein